MITIALDEQGEFEQAKSSREPIFIAGILYDDRGDPNDAKNERMRLEKYYARVCGSAGTSFPEDLHYKEYEGGETNSHKVSLTKDQVRKTLGEFLQRGTYLGEKVTVQHHGKEAERKGRYHVFALLKSRAGKADLSGGRVSVLLDETVAGNLYIHMAEETVSRLVFHNPLFREIRHVQLDLATRRSILEDRDAEERFWEYIRLGYKENKERSTARRREILLTNSDIYRTAIEREMLERERNDIQIEWIGAKSIYYGESSPKMAFLYLADSVCSILGYQLTGKHPGEWIEEFEERAAALAGAGRNVIFAYDGVDSFFRKAWIRAEEGDYYQALSLAWDAFAAGSEMTDYYRRVWLPLLQKKLREEAETANYILALRKLRPMILRNGLDQEKLVFLFTELEKLLPVLDASRCPEVFYELNDTGVTVYTHIGDSARAEAYFEKCRAWAEHVGTEAYLATCNKMAVFLCDHFRYEDALSTASDNVVYLEEIQSLRKMMFPGARYFPGLAKAYSQLGQVYAYLRDNTAEEFFMKALASFEKDSPDAYITMSYLLHFYIDTGREEAYTQLAKAYFGGESDLEKQFRWLVQEGVKEDPRISLKFALFVFIKGVYTFSMEKAGKKLLNKLLDVENVVRGMSAQAAGHLNGHPWEIIHKYRAFIALDLGKKELSETLIQRSQDCLREQGHTIRELIRFGVYQYEEKRGGTPDPEDYEALKKVITYMYR